MKKIIFLGALALLTYSCSSDDNTPVDNIDPTQQNVILPVKMSADGEAIKINYDGTKILNLVSTTNPNNKIVFTYSGDYVSAIKYYDNNVLQVSYDYTYTNDLMTSNIFKEYDDNGAIIANINYTYTHISSSLINVKKQANEGPNNTYTINATYTFSNGNMTNATGTGTGISYGVSRNYTISRNYTYTDKNYPFKNVKGFDKLIFNGDNEDGSSILFSGIKNNLSTYKDLTTFTYSGGSGTSSSSYKYNTTFNSSGYPTNEIVQSTDLNGVPYPSQPSVYTFEYNH